MLIVMLGGWGDGEKTYYLRQTLFFFQLSTYRSWYACVHVCVCVYVYMCICVCVYMCLTKHRTKPVLNTANPF